MNNYLSHRAKTILLIMLLSIVSVQNQTLKAQIQDTIPAYVVGGVNAPNQYPFFVNIVDPWNINNATVEPFCGASLLSSEWVLTAGHCVINFATGGTMDSLGLILNTYIRSNPNASHERIMSDYIAIHPNFNIFGSDLDGDIALIHLKKESTHIPLEIVEQDDTVYSKAGNEALIIGFGIYDIQNPFEAPDTLQQADIGIISNLVCNEPNRYDGAINDRMVCAGRLNGEPKGAGVGDSGGPLMVNINGTLKQVGIVSFGNEAYSTTTHPGIYTRIASYRNWIDSTIYAYNNPAVVHTPKTDRARIHVSEYAIQITTEKPMPTNATYQIYDSQGSVVQSGILQANIYKQAIYLENINPALYILKIDANGSYHCLEKFIKN